MVMRISSIQAFNNGVSSLGRNYSNLIRTQEQISSGNRILTPADDPVASVRLLQLEQQQAVLGPYKENLTAAKNSLTQEETTITSVVNVLKRIRELAVQAGARVETIPCDETGAVCPLALRILAGKHSASACNARPCSVRRSSTTRSSSLRRVRVMKPSASSRFSSGVSEPGSVSRRALISPTGTRTPAPLDFS